MSSSIQVQLENRILSISIDRPAKKNALTREMYTAMSDAMAEAAGNKEVKVILIKGGADFTAGNDLSDFLNQPPTAADSPVVRFVRTVATNPVPTVAAVDGLAVGIGTTMLLHCDFVYATPNTKFVLPFINLALVPEAASSLLLPQLAGYQRAAELLMLGEPFNAEKAREIGLVNRICDQGDLNDVAIETAMKLAAKPSRALRATKALMRGEPEPLGGRIAAEMTIFAECLQSPEAKEAFMAFLQKRKPDFAQFD